MAERDDELPEGTDHIINGAMETGDEGGGFIGSAGTDGTGGTALDASGGREMDDRNDQQGGVIEQLRGQAEALRDQAGDRARELADSGKTRASDALDELSRVVGETAETIDERMGDDYGDYARRAADAVSGFAETLRRKDVDELYGDLRDAVKKSPAIAIGIAAVVGFTLARLIKSGLEEKSSEGETRSNRAEA